MPDSKIKLYIFPLVQDKAPLPILEFMYGAKKSNKLFQSIDPALYADIWITVQNPEEADYLLIPHNYSDISKNESYSVQCLELAQKHSKTILLFAYQDSAEEIVWPQTIVFRASQYRLSLRTNEIMMPAYIEDLGVMYGVTPRQKREKPSVGFVGKAGFESFAHRFRFFIKNTFLRKDPFKDGLYYRRKAMGAFKRDERFETHFIIRDSYSGNLKSITLDPAQARKEYVDNMIESDFTLSPKGDGNYSLRFYETLSLGRIPIFIDTECVLPLEDTIDYDQFIIRVPYEKINELGDIVTTAFSSWSEDDFSRRQRRAREAFTGYLAMPAFIKTAFAKEYLSRYS